MSQNGRTVAALLDDSERIGWSNRAPWPTGFATLDQQLDGGLRAGELTLLAGAQGLGKTTLSLQMSRNIARSGARATYVCYEHTGRQLLDRLVAMEVGLNTPYGDLLSAADLRTLLASRGSTARPAADDEPATRVADALRSLRDYGHRLSLVGAGGARTDLDCVSDLIGVAGCEGSVVFVDYLQKIPVGREELGEDERVTRVVERLKDTALDAGVPVVAIVAVDKSGLDGARTRLADLRGSTAMAYEADVALLLNDKPRIVARHHLVYGSPDAARFQEYVVCSVEKNRNGRAGADLELHKAFDRGCFDPEDRRVSEQLRDERIYVD